MPRSTKEVRAQLAAEAAAEDVHWGICITCGRERRLNEDGTIVSHRVYHGHIGIMYGCRGSGCAPIGAEEDQEQEQAS